MWRSSVCFAWTDGWMDGWMDGWSAVLLSVPFRSVCTPLRMIDATSKYDDLLCIRSVGSWQFANCSLLSFSVANEWIQMTEEKWIKKILKQKTWSKATARKIKCADKINKNCDKCQRHLKEMLYLKMFVEIEVRRLLLLLVGNVANLLKSTNK